MAIPGPAGPLWAGELLLWAAAVAVLGEAARRLLARRVPFLRTPQSVERFLFDLYLGGAVYYLVAALPIGLFSAAAVVGLPVAAAVGIFADHAVHRPPAEGRLRDAVRPLVRPAPLAAIVAAIGLFAVELAPAVAAPTGNTFDSSLLTTYVALLLQHGAIPLSFHPYGTPMILYPQGSTVWFGSAQLAFGLPPARTALLVTPLFLALAPLAGYVFGRRAFGSERAGAAVAVLCAVLGPSTRAVVGGSNDFAIAFPLVLLLVGYSDLWTQRAAPGWGDALGFGLLLGYSAAINPVGAEWLFPTLCLLRAVVPRGTGAPVRSWLVRWAGSLAAGLAPVVPSLYVLGRGLGSPGFVPGAGVPPAGQPLGITTAQLIADVDPLLFRGRDIALSPIPLLRIELAILLVAGLAVAVGMAIGVRSLRSPGVERGLRTVGAAGVAIGGWLLVLTAAGAGWPVARSLSYLTSASELSTWAFAFFGIVATIPLILVLDRLVESGRAAAAVTPAVRTRFRHLGGRPTAAVMALAAALAIVAPGIVATPAELPGVLATTYRDFGNVSAGDFALLVCAGADLPDGARVLVAPGSAAEFLPGYARGITLLYPMEPGWYWQNASYRLVVGELTNATLDPAGRAALTALDVGYVAVTGANTVLWKPFSPAPFLADPTNFSAVFESGDAYLFATHGGEPAFVCP